MAAAAAAPMASRRRRSFSRSSKEDITPPSEQIEIAEAQACGDGLPVESSDNKGGYKQAEVEWGDATEASTVDSATTSGTHPLNWNEVAHSQGGPSKQDMTRAT